jgi:hypothetical protein
MRTNTHVLTILGVPFAAWSVVPTATRPDTRVWGPPTVYIVDRQGRLVGRATGPKPWDSPKGRQFIEAVLAAPATP